MILKQRFWSNSPQKNWTSQWLIKPKSWDKWAWSCKEGSPHPSTTMKANISQSYSVEWKVIFLPPPRISLSPLNQCSWECNEPSQKGGTSLSLWGYFSPRAALYCLFIYSFIHSFVYLFICVSVCFMHVFVRISSVYYWPSWNVHPLSVPMP